LLQTISGTRATDGVEVLTYLRREDEFANALRPDLLLLDLNMPRMGGREFLHLVKNDAEFRVIPLVVPSTSKAEQDILKSYELQANCYVTKPVDFDRFVTIVQRLSEFWFSAVCLPVKTSLQRWGRHSSLSILEFKLSPRLPMLEVCRT
jgi:chemotaxis family two-component system response regulator Rcp1